MTPTPDRAAQRIIEAQLRCYEKDERGEPHHTTSMICLGCAADALRAEREAALKDVRRGIGGIRHTFNSCIDADCVCALSNVMELLTKLRSPRP